MVVLHNCLVVGVKSSYFTWDISYEEFLLITWELYYKFLFLPIIICTLIRSASDLTQPLTTSPCWWWWSVPHSNTDVGQLCRVRVRPRLAWGPPPSCLTSPVSPSPHLTWPEINLTQSSLQHNSKKFSNIFHHDNFQTVISPTNLARFAKVWKALDATFYVNIGQVTSYSHSINAV